MTISTDALVASVADTLQDASHTRWTVVQLVGYLNDGVRNLIVKRPDVNPTRVLVTPAAGARQALPSGAVALIDIIGNATGSLGAITKVDMHTLSAVSPTWQSGTQSATAIHFMYDLADPRTYYLYPPSNGSGSIEMIHSVFPSDTAAGGTIPISDAWTDALVHYVKYRAYEVDSEYENAAALSAAHYAAYKELISDQAQATGAVSPKA